MRYFEIAMYFVLLTLFTFSCKSDDAITPMAPVVIDIPENLDFNSAFSINIADYYYFRNSFGFLASNESNKLYHATWIDSAVDAYREKLGGYDLPDGNNQEEIYISNSFADGIKRIENINSKIYVISSTAINTYDLNLNFLESIAHEGWWTGFDTAVDQGAIWAVSSGYNDSPNKLDIHWWDDAEGKFILQSTFDEKRAGAAIEVVGDNLYIFGGHEGVNLIEPTNTILIYNIHTKEFETPVIMPFELLSATATKYEHLIFVAGLNFVNESFVDFENYFGVYNTLDGTFSEIEISLENNLNTMEWVSAMSVLNDKLYIATNATVLGPEVQVVDLK